MGVYGFLKKLYEEKRSDLLRYLLSSHLCHFGFWDDTNRQAHVRARPKFFVHRIRICRESRKETVPKKYRERGEKEKVLYRRLQSIAQARVRRNVGTLRMTSCLLLNEDVCYKYYEVALVDILNPAIRDDPRLSWLATHQLPKVRERRLMASIRMKTRRIGKSCKCSPTWVALKCKTGKSLKNRLV